MNEQIKIAGFDVQLTKKAVKYLRITVSKGGVRVTAPVRLPYREIETMVAQKSGWIAAQLELAARRLPELPEKYVNGETLRLWGKRLAVRFEQGSRLKLLTQGDTAVIYTKEPCESAILELLRREVKREVESRLPLWEKVTGLKSSAFGVRSMTSRWGTCNTSNGRLTFSLHLARKPPECLDYIIVHELCHLAVKNHGAAFKALMDKFYPKWREARKLLALTF